MPLIDTHVHIDFYTNPMKVAYQYESMQIYTLFVTNLPEIFEKHYESFKIFKYVRLCIGYHPQIAEEYKFKKSLFEECVSKTKYIGEVGLDFNNIDNFTKKHQIEVFEFITSSTFNKGRVYTIHSKGTEDEVLEILTSNKVKHAIFHWYSGKLSTLDKIADKGFYFSINPKMLYSKGGQKILERIPNNLILFETDGPFARINKKIIYPHDIPNLYNEIDKKIPKFQEITFNNFRRLLIEKDISL